MNQDEEKNQYSPPTACRFFRSMQLNRLNLGLKFKRFRSKLDRLRSACGSGINRFEHRVYSQHREDGIIEYLVAVSGIINKRCIEFGFGPVQGNCHNLVFHHGFNALFMDGSSKKCSQMDALLKHKDRNAKVVNSFLTLDNLNELVRTNGFGGEIALLSIDVDGNDYWFWEAITACNPVLVVIEYNASFGPEKSITVPYDPAFVRYQKHPSGLYHGASLAALARLGKSKNYTLVGADSTGVNAFFVRDDHLTGELPAMSAKQAFHPHRGRTTHKNISQADQWNAIAAMPFVNV